MEPRASDLHTTKAQSVERRAQNSQAHLVAIGTPERARRSIALAYVVRKYRENKRSGLPLPYQLEA